MSKLYFADYVARAMPKSKVRALLQSIEAGPEETRLMLERFCDGKPAAVINDEWLPEAKQRKVAEWLSYKLESWFWDNLSAFKSCDIMNIIKLRLKHDE